MSVSRILVINLTLTALILVLLLGHHWILQGELLPSARTARIEHEFQLLQTPTTPVSRLDAVATASASAILTGSLSSTSAVAMDVATKKILWQKNANAANYPASTTKIVTALVAREFYDLDDIITIESEDLAFGKNVGWNAGDSVRVAEILRALLIVSANEAGMILADHAPGGYDAFIARMNTKAREMGLTQTNFVNPQGFDDDAQRVSARDLAIASLELLRDDFLRDTVDTAHTTITTASGHTFDLNNTNKLLSKTGLGYSVHGIKTGTTALANEALVSLLEKNSHPIIVVVLSTNSRYNDTMKIADHVFGNYVWQPTTLN